jgi:glycosyltransferase involved in cell wall biosynthesis
VIRPRLAVLCDLFEENWPSMDLVADELVRALVTDFATEVEVLAVRPSLARRATRIPRLGARRTAQQADIFLGRFWDYPRRLRRERADLYHVSDHSYAHLLHRLPRERAGVYCHDLDAFRCLLEPKLEPRPLWFRAMTRRVLEGLERAPVVFYSTNHVRQRIERAGLVEGARLVHAPYGTAAEFVAPGEPSDALAQRDLALEAGSYVMHVGSCIPRKRIDVLLEAFHEASKHSPGLRLLQVGGVFAPEHVEAVRRFGLQGDIIQVRGIPRTTLAALYRGAAVVLHPSDAEGFGLPVIEALACGAPVVASDIGALREAGGDAVVYVGVGDAGAFARELRAVLEGAPHLPERATRLAHAARFSWTSHARTILDSYQRLLS